MNANPWLLTWRLQQWRCVAQTVNREVIAGEGGIVVCENCAIMVYTDQCKVDDKILCTIPILDKNNCKCQVSITQDVLGKALKVSIKDEINFWKQLMKKDLMSYWTPEAILFHI